MSVATTAPAPAATRGTRTSRAALAVFAGLVVFFAFAPQWGSASTLNSLVRFFTLLCIGQMWNLLAGYGGMVSVGQQLYIGLGAYSLVFFGNNHGVNPFVCVAVAAALAAVLAVPVAGVAFRLRGGYFAIGTWVIAEVGRLLVSNSNSLGSGTGTTITALVGIDITTRQQVTYWLALAAGAGSIAGVFWLLRSRVGTALLALGDNEQAARALGVAVTRTKLVAYIIAAAGCAAAGAVIYLNLLNVTPDAAFSVNWTAYMIFIAVIGGIGTIEGPIIGTIIFYALQEQLADQGSWYLILLGVVAIVITIWLPNGIWGWVTRRTGVELFPLGRRLRAAPPTSA